MNKFFTHPMRPFFVGAAVLAILGALVFFISPGAIVLHRQIFLELMLPAAYGGFLTAAMLEWTGYKGRLKPVATVLAALLLAASVLLPFAPQTASFFVAAYWLVLLLFCAWLIWLDRNTDNFALLMLLAAFTVFSDGLCRQRRLEPAARASASEHGGGHVRIRARPASFWVRKPLKNAV